jgi:hypothetical protein
MACSSFGPLIFANLRESIGGVQSYEIHFAKIGAD